MTLEDLQSAIAKEDWRSIWIASLHGDLPAEGADVIRQSAAPDWLKNVFNSQTTGRSSRREDEGEN